MSLFPTAIGSIGSILNRFRAGASYPAVLDDGNTVAWFDSAENITKDGSDFVSVWGDKSGLEHDLLQAIETNQPLWTEGGVLFDGVDNYMKCAAFTLIQPTVVYTAFKQVTWTSSAYLYDGNATYGMGLTMSASSPNLRAFAGAISTENGNLAVDTYGVIRVEYNGASSRLIVNETTPTTGNWGTNTAGGFTLGGRAAPDRFANIKVKEVILRKITDTAPNEQAIYDYLKAKHPELPGFGIIGDSISEGTGTNDWVVHIPNETYKINNHAAGGAKIATEMDGQVTAAVDDDNTVIILALGTNDDINPVAGVLQAEVEENIIELKASNTNATIYYMNVLPRWTDSTGDTPIDQSNIRTQIAAACAAQNITCWDTLTDPWIEASDTSDGIHTTDAGGLKIWNEIASRI